MTDFHCVPTCVPPETPSPFQTAHLAESASGGHDSYSDLACWMVSNGCG